MAHKQMPLGEPTQRSHLCSSTGQDTQGLQPHVTQTGVWGDWVFFNLFSMIFFYYHYFAKVSQYLLVSICSILSASKSTFKVF